MIELTPALSKKLCFVALLLLPWGQLSRAQTHSEATLMVVPPLSSSRNLYSEAAAGKISPQCADALARVYVPNHASGSVTVIDPDAFRVVGSFAVGRGPQHVVPSWDLQTLWIINNGHGSRLGSVTVGHEPHGLTIWPQPGRYSLGHTGNMR